MNFIQEGDSQLLQQWLHIILSKLNPSSILSGSQIAKLVEKQLAYYFCRDNLIKDVHLQKMFNPNDGFVALVELIKFCQLAELAWTGRQMSCQDHQELQVC